MEYLGFWVTCDGVIPINIKIEEITNMKPPTSQKDVRKFMGVITITAICGQGGHIH